MHISIFINQGKTDLVFQNVAENGRMYSASATFEQCHSGGEDSDILRYLADELDRARASVSALPPKPIAVKRIVFDGSQID